MEKHPELKKLFDSLTAERESILSKSRPLREERDRLVSEMTPLEKKAAELAKQIAEIERPRLAEIDNQRGALAKAMGGRSLSRSVAK